MPETVALNNFNFLRGGGEMGSLIRDKDWNQTQMGNPEAWPQTLRTMVNMLLDNPFGMYIVWGEEYLQIYNDGFRPILGSTKHPVALGISARETFEEIWTVIGPMFERVMKGEAVRHTDFMVPLNRNGYVEECYFDFSYSPIRLEDGKVGGILVTVIETTTKKKSEDAIKESEVRFRTMVDNIPNLAWMAKPDGWIYWYNQKWYDYTGTTAEQMEGWGWQSVHDPKQLPCVLKKWQDAIAEEKPFEMIFPLKGADGIYRQFLTRILPVKNSDGILSQWFGTNTDITQQIEIEEALKESEERFRSMAESTEVLIAVGDETSNIIYFNKAWSELTGRPMENLIEFGWIDLIDPDNREAYITLYLQAFEKKIAFNGEFRVLSKDGSYKWIFSKAIPRFHSNGTFAGYISSAFDITAFKQAEAGIRASENKFRAMVEQAPVAICVLTGENLIVEIANQKALELWGKSASQLIGKPLSEGMPNVEEQGFEGLLKEVFRSGEPFFGNEIPYAVIQNGKQEKLFLNFVIEATRDINDKIDGILVVAIDVSPQIKAKQSIQKSADKLNTVLESLPQMAWTALPNGEANYFSKSWSEYTGQTLEEALHYGWLKVVHSDFVTKTLDSWQHALKEGISVELETKMRSSEGQYRWMWVKGTPIKNELGEIIQWVGTVTDIHERKNFTEQMEIMVGERTKELEYKNKAYEKMNKELEAFAYISSHDLQEPLRKIHTFSTLILEKEMNTISETGKDYFKRMQYAVGRMQNLIDDLLSYSRTNTAEKKYEKADLNKIVQELKVDFKEEIIHKQAIIESQDLCELNVIYFQFRQLLYNLISNALKFSLPGTPPHIIIRTRIGLGKEFNNDRLQDQNSYCHCSVSDNGIGFDTQYSEKIFEMFQRLHGKSEYTGTGIGLAIVKKIVDNHNGVISATSAIGEGARFDIYIPVN